MPVVSRSWYRVMLPDGHKGFIISSAVSALSSPLKHIALHTQMPLLDAPDTLAPHKKLLHTDESVSILAGYGNYYYVSDKEDTEGWIWK